jgi:PDZ and LIM domain protein 5/6/7
VANNRELRDYLIDLCSLLRCAGRPQHNYGMAQMLSPSRISQDLPVPKCSTCGQFVPLEQLGDHICPPLSKPVTMRPSPGSASPPSRGPPPANTSVAFQPRPSPLATSNVGSQQTNAGPSSSAMLARVPQRAPSTPARESSARPILHPQPQPPGQSLQGRSGTPLGFRVSPGGSSISRSGTPASMLPGNMIPRDVSRSSRSASILPAKMFSPRDTGSPAPPTIAKISGTIGPGAVIPGAHHSPQQSFVPPPERGIDTKSGGEAGMAGVGRRGFAAVARAAMFALPPKHLEGPQADRKSDQPKLLDLDAVPRRASSLTDHLMA